MKDKITNDPFSPVNEQDIDAVIQLLKTRLPRSANTYNMALMSKTLKHDIKIYHYLDDISPNTWIICVAKREDYGTETSISAPMNPVITSDIKEAFSVTKAWDWEKAYMFAAIDVPIAKMIFEISTSVKHNGTTYLPHVCFVMDMELALKQDLTLPNGFEFKDLNNEQGVDFLVDNWKYTMEGTKEYARNVMSKCPSSGIYDVATGQLVTGILLNYIGLMGMLYSAKNYRGKGLAKICMKNMIKESAQLGHLPASTVETKNYASKVFHEKLGMKIAYESVDVLCSASGW